MNSWARICPGLECEVWCEKSSVLVIERKGGPQSPGLGAAKGRGSVTTVSPLLGAKTQ